jgi:hypothetical protein
LRFGGVVDSNGARGRPSGVADAATALADADAAGYENAICAQAGGGAGGAAETAMKAFASVIVSNFLYCAPRNPLTWALHSSLPRENDSKKRLQGSPEGYEHGNAPGVVQPGDAAGADGVDGHGCRGPGDADHAQQRRRGQTDFTSFG